MSSLGQPPGPTNGAAIRNYAGKLPVRRRLREGVDQNRSANGVAYQYRAIIEARDLIRERPLPPRIAGIRLFRHARVPDIVVGPKFLSQAVDELVVPFIMSHCASALNEQDLLLHALILSTLDSAICLGQMPTCRSTGSPGVSRRAA